jgi:type II secretory pathway component PulC
MLSDKRKGSARTKIILAIGALVVIAGAWSLFNISNVEPESNIESVIQPEIDFETVSAEEKTSDEREPSKRLLARIFKNRSEDENNRETVQTEANTETTSAGVKRLFMSIDEMSKFRVRPKFEDNQIVGVTILKLQDDSILAQLGLQKDDFIKRFDNIDINNVGALVNAMNWGISSKNSFDIEIIRNNEPMVVTYIAK